MGLFEAGFLRQAQAGELALFDAAPEGLAQIFLQSSESHAAEYSILI